MPQCKIRHLGVAPRTSISNTTVEELSAHGAAVVSLCVSQASRVTSVASLVASLRKLDASDFCGIDDAGLAQATRLVELNASDNRKIRTVTASLRSIRTAAAVAPRDNETLN